VNERVFLRVCVCVRVCVYIYIQLLATALSDSCAFLCVSGQELERFFCKVFCFPSVWRDRCVWGAFGGTFVTFDVAETHARFKIRVCGQEILQEEKLKKKKEKKSHLASDCSTERARAHALRVKRTSERRRKEKGERGGIRDINRERE